MRTRTAFAECTLDIFSETITRVLQVERATEKCISALHETWAIFSIVFSN